MKDSSFSSSIWLLFVLHVSPCMWLGRPTASFSSNWVTHLWIEIERWHKTPASTNTPQPRLCQPFFTCKKIPEKYFFIYLNDNMFWKEITSLLWSQLHHQHLNCAFSTRLRSACPSMFSTVKSSKKPGEATVGANSVDPHLRITIFADPVVTWQMCAADKYALQPFPAAEEM